MQLAVPNGRWLLTGGTGSLCRALVDRAKREGWPVEFTIFSRDEAKQGKMRQNHPECRYVLGDVRDAECLAKAMRRQDVCLHAAAMKVIPDAEANPDEVIKTNVFGSMNVVTTAIRMNVKRVIGVSTDKSCYSANGYGASKFLMEKRFQQANNEGDTQFNLTRYGNVVGSRGSVIPFFQRLVRESKPITITNKRMTRFWLSLDDAIDLVLLALSEPEGGTIVVPKAPGMKVISVAELIAPNSLIVDIGIRPGEKIHESLIQPSEAFHTDDVEAFFRIWPATSYRKGTMTKEQYTSEFPDHWLTNEEMLDMIDKSEGYD